MTKGIGRLLIALTAAAIALAASPAAAGQSRALLSVNATVSPGCQVQHRPDEQASPQIACSAGAGFSTRTSAHHDDQPLARASDLLGAPVRRGERVTFTSALQPARDPGNRAAPATQYLTISY